MEWTLGGCSAALGLLVLAWAAVRVVEWVWWSPRRLERALRAQGLRGNPYRVLYGDIKDDARLSKEVRSRPISPVSHRIIPRAVPGLHRAISQHGECTICANVARGAWLSARVEFGRSWYEGVAQEEADHKDIVLAECSCLELSACAHTSIHTFRW